MAHAAKISELTDGLFGGVAGARSQHASYRRMREQAAKTFRNTTHARTNQFDVQSKLTGLVEKFAVLNRDDLSDALQSRLDKLPPESKWMPEILSLLLQLSDRPLEKTKIEDVEALSKQSEDEQPALTWDDLLAERELDEPGLWDDVDRGYHSSGDDATVDEEAGSDDSAVTGATSIEDDTIALARLHVVQPDDSILNEFQGSSADKILSSTSELHLIRETLYMLRGYPTELYISDDSGTITVQRTHSETAASTTTHDLLLQFADVGSSINALRDWATRSVKALYLQSCQAATSSLLRDFDSTASTIEQRYVAPKQDIIVSLVRVRSEVETAASPLLRLSKVVATASDHINSSPFALFDALYDEIAVAEMSGDWILSSGLCHVFMAGLRTYLRPLATWIQSGHVDQSDTASMVLEADPDCELGSLWYNRFAIRKLGDGTICAPKFLHGLAHRVFAIGKSQAFLQALGGVEVEHIIAGTTKVFDSLRENVGDAQLVPFSQLLDEALEAWIAEISRESGSQLQQRLLHEHGFLRIVDRLEEVFCSKDGALFQTFADTLFWRIDHQPQAWTQTFLLGELASNTFASSDRFDAESLTVELDRAQHHTSTRQVSAISLQTTFSWPVQNITRARTSNIHSKTFAFLLQTYRSKYLLQPQAVELKTFVSKGNDAPLPARTTLALRHRLLCFVDVVHNHITSTTNVLHLSLKRDLRASDDIDVMAIAWNTHIKEMDTTLLLTQKFHPIREAVTNCLELCERFARLWAASTAQNAQEIASMGQELDRLVSFIAAGVRGVGRASASKALGELAERLEWMKQ